MDKKYLFVYQKPRLANQLYFILHCYLNNLLYINCPEKFKLLNFNKYLANLVVNEEIKPKVKQIFSLSENYYFQVLNKHYTELDLVNFINDTIITNSYFINKTLNDQDVAIHIRAGDYLNNQCFNLYKINRIYYLEKSIQKIKEYTNTNRVYIFSDDLNYCKNQFRSIFIKYFKRVIYIKKTQEEDLLHLSTFKYKILWNSTFSFWSAYIASVLYNNDNIVVAPDFYCTEIMTLPYFKHWLTIPNCR